MPVGSIASECEEDVPARNGVMGREPIGVMGATEIVLEIRKSDVHDDLKIGRQGEV